MTRAATAVGGPALVMRNRREWRRWLARNGKRQKEIWLVQFRKGSPGTAVAYDDALDEALCFGWIDSLVKRIDGDRYARKFTRRTNPLTWSALNRKRMKRLIAEGRVTRAGLAVAGYRNAPKRVEQRSHIPERLPPALAAVIRQDTRAWSAFRALAPSHRRAYIGWVTSAKREETRLRRLAEAVRVLARGEKLGLK